MGEVTFDGTRVRSNNDRYETWTAKDVEKQLAELEAQFGELLNESERVDAAEDARFGLQNPTDVPPELADAKARQQRLLEAQKELAAAGAARRREGIKTPAQLPSTDPDSSVLPNKEGGYAPNYTPTTAVGPNGVAVGVYRPQSK